MRELEIVLQEAKDSLDQFRKEVEDIDVIEVGKMKDEEGKDLSAKAKEKIIAGRKAMEIALKETNVEIVLEAEDLFGIMSEMCSKDKVMYEKVKENINEFEELFKQNAIEESKDLTEAVRYIKKLKILAKRMVELKLELNQLDEKTKQLDYLKKKMESLYRLIATYKGVNADTDKVYIALDKMIEGYVITASSVLRPQPSYKEILDRMIGILNNTILMDEKKELFGKLIELKSTNSVEKLKKAFADDKVLKSVELTPKQLKALNDKLASIYFDDIGEYSKELAKKLTEISSKNSTYFKNDILASGNEFDKSAVGKKIKAKREEEEKKKAEEKKKSVSECFTPEQEVLLDSYNILDDTLSESAKDVLEGLKNFMKSIFTQLSSVVSMIVKTVKKVVGVSKKEATIAEVLIQQFDLVLKDMEFALSRSKRIKESEMTLDELLAESTTEESTEPAYTPVEPEIIVEKKTGTERYLKF